MVLFGWGRESVKISDAGILKCNNCKNYTTFEIRATARKVSLYFIPVAKWDRKYYLVCITCQYGFEIDEKSKNDILEDIKLLPNNIESGLIWNEIDNIFVEQVNKLKVNKDEEYYETLINNTKLLSSELNYDKNHINYILSIYFKFISESPSKKSDETGDKNFCKYCGSELKLGSNICSKCGK